MCLSFIYSMSRPMALAFYPPPHPPKRNSGGQPSHVDGIHELAASSGNSPTITRRLVVSYTTFSPLPLSFLIPHFSFLISHLSLLISHFSFQKRGAVVLFFPHQLSPTASTFRSGAPCAARTFLSCLLAETPAAEPEQCFPSAKVQKNKIPAKENRTFL